MDGGEGGILVYQRSYEIESRLENLLQLIKTGRYSTPQLAAVLHVSHPTVSRSISALRQRGYTIESVKGPEGWAYKLNEDLKITRNSSISEPRAHVPIDAT